MGRSCPTTRSSRVGLSALHREPTSDPGEVEIATVLAAGHETTAAGLAWLLYALATHPEVQTKLRNELLAADKEDLNALPYLDQVIRESLRVYPPVELTSRQPWGHEVLPLSEPIVDLDGRTLTELRLGSPFKVYVR